ncbi:hypothetical protein OIU84_010708 [Salix udensis]|uniref:Replication protein A OB domain-containing protein n=1 Tax=Salix udensis TaxID=889485 RepID=A0AAD6JM13_9ROSI|nr:hypothetical protein OIU84_010708 [Salix udensis]
MHPACSESQNHGGNLEGCAEFLTDCSAHSKLQKSLCSYEEQAPARIIPINALNPYQERWAIKGRVTAKGDLCCYYNAQGDGKVFYFDLLDSEGGQIRVACFNAVVDCFYDVMEVGYLISKEDCSIPQQQFKPISEIEISENNSILDVFRVVVFVNPSFPLLRKNGMETQERILNLKDGSGRTADYQFGEILATREGQKLKEMVDSGVFPVLAVKAGKTGLIMGSGILFSALKSFKISFSKGLESYQTMPTRKWHDLETQDGNGIEAIKNLTSVITGLFFKFRFRTHKIDLGNSIPGVRGGDTGLPSKEIIHEEWKMHMMIPDLRK